MDFDFLSNGIEWRIRLAEIDAIDSASMNASQLESLSLPTEYAGRPLSEKPNLNIIVDEVWH